MTKVVTDITAATDRIRQRRMIIKITSAASTFMSFALWLFALHRPKKYHPHKHYMKGPGPKWQARHSSSKQ